MSKQMEGVDLTIMLASHDAFRRDVACFRDAAASDELPHRAWDVFTRQLHFHHTSEDDLVWPAVRDRLEPLTGEVPVLAQMVDEHARIEPLLAAVERTRATGGHPLAAALDELAASLDAHLAHEERDALPLIQASFSPEEWGQVGAQIQARMGADDAAEFFPWLLAGADPQRTNDVLGMLPPPVRETYENVWRPQYEERVGA